MSSLPTDFSERRNNNHTLGSFYALLKSQIYLTESLLHKQCFFSYVALESRINYSESLHPKWSLMVELENQIYIS